MTRPLLVWLSFLACAALLLGALALVSRHARGLEAARAVAAAEADAGQRVRLALWRMDSEAAALLVLENNRPPAAFAAAASPPPEHAHCYFEIGPGGVLAAPPDSALRERLRRLLDLPPPALAAQTLPEAPGPRAQAAPGDIQSFANGALALAAANVSDEAPAPAAAQAATSLPAAKGKQFDADFNDLRQRSEVVQRAMTRNTFYQQSDAAQLPAAAPEQTNAQAIRPAPGRAPAAPPLFDAVPGFAMPVEQSAAPGQQGAPPAAWTAPIVAPAAPPPPRLTTFQPLWIAGELLMVRALGEPPDQRVQGVWLKQETLAGLLLGGIRDLLPGATLRPYQPLVFTYQDAASGTPLQAAAKPLDDAPLALVSLPWELVPGPLPAPPPDASSPLAILLGLAWGGAAAALIAAALLLHGVLALSERRASFVSSVTHELRTPLTTFNLYSEMLAAGMVPDPARQRAYLETLHTEAGRLCHLVENVLAYSRIERGSARARVEDVSVAALAARVRPRLDQRAAAAGARLESTLAADVAGLTLRTDASAIEQILFNLVDNAAKYAPQQPGDPPWQLGFGSRARRLTISLRDHGPGIPPAERRRLFRPFHKSAREAANSQPGVGLGLALSRRLARALGGSLEIADHPGPGTEFRLELPLG
jgi:signal transduction histidine kinase